MNTRCYTCGKTFSTIYSLKRHVMGSHPNVEGDTAAGVQGTEEESLSESESTKNEASMEEGDEEEESEDEDDNEGDENETWREQIAHTIDALHSADVAKYSITTTKDFFNEPGLSFFVNELHQQVQGLLDCARSIEDSKLHLKIVDTIDELTEKGYDNEEAEECAWMNRKYAIREMMKTHRDIFDNYFKELDDDNTDSDKDDVKDSSIL